jgi:N-acetylglucosaminyldiphosphoundecaprenol N-acetyl-beta-D-mannosaminyltransferase
MLLSRKWSVPASRWHRKRRPHEIHAGSSSGDRAKPLASPSVALAAPISSIVLPDDLSREVYCILGMPVDAIGMQEVLNRIRAAAATRTSFLISTPNLNFLAISQQDKDFRESLMLSDLCTADGVAITLVARLAGIPVTNRITGADIFDALKVVESTTRPLKIFLFGGAEGVAAAASRALNGQASGVRCIGWHNPGFCSAEEMSQDDIINTINSSGADFLVASLGAQKGQSWLQRNHRRLSIPIRAHLGASLNFQAGTVKRAPRLIRKAGLEWLWRIKEEPYLWRRYWNDGSMLLRLLVTRVLPCAFLNLWLRLGCRRGEDLVITQTHGGETLTLSFSGPADARHADKAIPVFREAIAAKKRIALDFSNARTVDARFLGLLLMLKKALQGSGAMPVVVGISPALKWVFHLNGLDFKSSVGT